MLGLAAGYYTCLEKRMGGAASSLEEKKEHFTKMIRDYHNNSYLQLLGNFFSFCLKHFVQLIVS